MSKNEGAAMVTIEQVKQFLAKHFAFKVLDKRITPTLYGWLVSLVPDEYYTSSTYRPTIPGEGGLQIDRETGVYYSCLLYTSPSPRDRSLSRMPSSA